MIKVVIVADSVRGGGVGCQTVVSADVYTHTHTVVCGARSTLTLLDTQLIRTRVCWGLVSPGVG